MESASERTRIRDGSDSTAFDAGETPSPTTPMQRRAPPAASTRPPATEKTATIQGSSVRSGLFVIQPAQQDNRENTAIEEDSEEDEIVLTSDTYRMVYIGLECKTHRLLQRIRVNYSFWLDDLAKMCTKLDNPSLRDRYLGIKGQVLIATNIQKIAQLNAKSTISANGSAKTAHDRVIDQFKLITFESCTHAEAHELINKRNTARTDRRKIEQIDDYCKKIKKDFQSMYRNANYLYTRRA